MFATLHQLTSHWCNTSHHTFVAYKTTRECLYSSFMASKAGPTLAAVEVDFINRIHARFPNGEPTRFHYFYTNQSPFSNFFPKGVTENGVEFHCTEQYMMYHKASE